MKNLKLSGKLSYPMSILSDNEDPLLINFEVKPTRLSGPVEIFATLE